MKKDRSKSAKRMLEVQKHLHSIEELKYLRLKQQIDKCETEQRELTEALSSDDALHGLFLDMSVKRIQALKLEENRLMPILQRQARVLVDHGGRVKNTEKLVEELQYEERRAEERSDLDEIIEVTLAKHSASLKQDQ
jgi:hypothetical protein